SRAGLMVYRYDYFRNITRATGLVSDSIRFFREDSMGRIWIATDEGLSVFWHGRIVNYTEANGLLGKAVLSWYEDTEKNVWIGTDLGLNCFSGEELRRYSPQDGLAGEAVYEILQDRQGGIWLLTNRGLGRFNGQAVESYGVFAGFFGQIVLRGAWTLDADGRLWFGTNRGACRHNPEGDIPNLSPPMIHLTELKADGQPVPVVNGRCELPDSVRTVTVDWVGLSYRDEQGIRYRYLLDGLYPDWTEPTREHGIRLTFPPPGTYTLKVLARNHAGIWSPRPLTVSVEIRAPFWRTAPFLWTTGLVLLAVAGVAIVTARRRWSVREAAWREERQQMADRIRRLEQMVAPPATAGADGAEAAPADDPAGGGLSAPDC
ncbi:MAG TPA: two-component regulator propeller domain-containing protein, partial [Acidobacteriota bacterium]|nr:two-component regulator propeller domain-containing protein [Acidobacteriota bacterium]